MTAIDDTNRLAQARIAESHRLRDTWDAECNAELRKQGQLPDRMSASNTTAWKAYRDMGYAMAPDKRVKPQWLVLIFTSYQGGYVT